jgi:hypothetical protein
MEKMKSMQLWLAIGLIVVLFSACQKDDDTPDYVGTWTRTETVTEDGVTMTLKINLIIRADKYEELVQVKIGEKFVDIIKVSGPLSVSAGVMTIEIKSLAITSYSMTGMPTGTLITYDENSSEFNQFMNEFQIDKIQTASYSVEGKSLTVGGYVYTKQ